MRSENPDALHALALTELKLGEPNDAIEHLGRALAVAPQELMIAVNLAQAKILSKDVKGAEEILIRTCKASPQSTSAIIVLGAFYLFAEQTFRCAERQFRQALTMDFEQRGCIIQSCGIAE